MSAVPPPVGAEEYLYSPAVRQGVDFVFPIAPTSTWDAFVRGAYEAQNKLIQRQADALLHRGNVTAAEAHNLVELQRNRLVVETRNKLSPAGRLYSEILKSSKSLPTLERLLEQKGSIEGVLSSVGKARKVVNRFAMVWRLAGPALIVVDMSLTAIVIVRAPAQDRGRIAAGESGRMIGGVTGGAAGAWAGCVTAAALVSPSLLVPVVGEITEGTACLVGSIGGGLGGGWAGSTLGRAGSEAIYNATDFRWLVP